eukprot:scaffold22522_cov54-Phaeocystis_antarctica.AAC.1
MRGASRHAHRGRPPARGGGKTGSTPAVAAPRHNPKGARRIPALNPNPSPSAYPAALTANPWPRPRLTSAVSGLYTRLTRGASRHANRGRPPAAGRRRNAKVPPTRTANPSSLTLTLTPPPTPARPRLEPEP